MIVVVYTSGNKKLRIKIKLKVYSGLKYKVRVLFHNSDFLF